MKQFVEDLSLLPIIDKVKNNERLTLEDGVTMYNSHDLSTIGMMANYVNRKRNGDNVYFIQNLYINPTNICEASCSFCGYRRSPGEEGAYTMSMDDLLKYVAERYNENIREFHIVGGHNDNVDFDYYLDTVRVLKAAYPHVVIKAYSAAEIVFFAKLSGLSTREVLQKLTEVGLDTLPGGGAEILTEEYRQKLSPDKATAQEWLDVHEIAQAMGMKTHATMLYGSIESYKERIIHMLKIRELQDKYHGFLVFIPLAVQPKQKTASIQMRTAAFDDLKTIAISRLMLDNVPHIKAYWIDIGVQLTQIALSYGADDIHGTIIEERISHAVGAKTEAGLTREDLVWLIKGANRIPIERDTFYSVVKKY